MSASPISLATVRFFTQTGTLAPLAFGKLWSYAAGTNTPQALYSDAGGLSALPNPVILDANGEAQVWMGANAYKFNLLDAANVQQANWPQDNISSPAALAAAAQAAAQAFATAADTAVKTLLRAEIVQQTNTAFPTTGTGSAYLLSPITPILAYAAGQRYNVQFHLNSVSGATIAVSGLAAVTLKQYNFAGAKIGANLIKDQIADIEYDGTYWIVLNQLPFPDAGMDGVRQCVLSGPIDANGDPDYLPSTSATLDLVTKNITETTPLYVTAADGYSDRNGVAVDNVSTTLPANKTLWIYMDVQSDGSIALNWIDLAPYESFYVDPVTKVGYVFNVSEMKMYRSNGFVAPRAYTVLVGWATTNATTITNCYTVPFLFRKWWSNTPFPTVAGAGTFKHYISFAGGNTPKDCEFKAVCITTDLGYSVGTELDLGFAYPYIIGTVDAENAKIIYDGTPITMLEADGSAVSAIDPAKWTISIYISRGW